jgi:proteic killer suppression protein
VIKVFKSRDARRLFEGERVPRFANIAKVAMRKLQMLHAAQRIDSLRIPPHNRLEALKGDRKGQWSISINDHAHQSELAGLLRLAGRRGMGRGDC